MRNANDFNFIQTIVTRQSHPSDSGLLGVSDLTSHPLIFVAGLGIAAMIR